MPIGHFKVCESCKMQYARRRRASCDQWERSRFCSVACLNEWHAQRRRSRDFWDLVDRNGPIMRPELSRCWIWTGAKKENGYGIVTRYGRQIRAHRIAAESAGMSIDGLMVLHACDNPPCVNPAHLRAGDHADNTRDMMERNRQNRGRRNPNAKLTDDAVRLIRERYISGEGNESLARAFGVSGWSIRNVTSGKSWRHVS